MNAALAAAIVGFIGVVLGLVIRDGVLQLYFLRRKRQTELEDRLKRREEELETLYRSELIKTRDVVRLYADPLLESSKSLNYRLAEILEQKGRATFLLPNTPQSEFVRYKRISTLYRLAVLLGWIRAYRKERSYVDPGDTSDSNDIERAVERVEAALADGPHVEAQRLNELLRLWVPSCSDLTDTTKRELGVALDNLLHAVLTEESKTSALELPDLSRQRLCCKAAEIISTCVRVDISPELVRDDMSRAVVFFGIKEAYLYRDWQQAIGELVLVPVSGAARRFDTMGYFSFEEIFLASQESNEKRWIRRLDELFVGLEPHKEDVFDARRDQLRSVHYASRELQAVLEKRVNHYLELTKKEGAIAVGRR